MKVQRKVVIKKYTFPLDGVYNYNAQIWSSLDGRNWYYCGFGRFCRNLEEAKRYKKEKENET